MRIINFLPAALLVSLAACNNSSDKSSAVVDSTTTTTVTHDTTMVMNHPSTDSITALPAVPDGAKVFFKNLKDGQTVKSPFKVEMGVEGLRIDTAGAIAAGSGHHHLLIDAGDSIPAGQVVPKDAQHLHFGKGQTSTDVTLPAGKHVLTLQVADGIHRSYGSKLATTITVNVQ